MAPGEANIIHWDNVDFDWIFQFVDQNERPHDLSGSTFEMDIATSAGAAATLALTTANGGILSTDLANGKITITFDQGALAVGEYVYDLVRVTGGDRELFVYGTFTMLKGVTQP